MFIEKCWIKHLNSVGVVCLHGIFEKITHHYLYHISPLTGFKMGCVFAIYKHLTPSGLLG